MLLRFFTLLYWLDRTARAATGILCITVFCISFILGIVSILLFFGTLPGLPGLDLKARIIACIILFITARAGLNLCKDRDEIIMLVLGRSDWGGSLFDTIAK